MHHNRFLNPARIEYTAGIVFSAAGIARDAYKLLGNRSLFCGCEIVFSIMKDATLDRLLERKLTLQAVHSFDGAVQVPVVLEGGKDFAVAAGDKLYVEADIITLPFLLLSRFEETLSDRRDAYGRFSYGDSLARSYGFIHIPLVDEYAMLLRKAVRKHFPQIPLQPNRKPRFVPTHDVDEVCRFGGFRQNAKTIIGGDLFARKAPALALESFRQLVNLRSGRGEDPYVAAVDRLIEVSRESGLRSEFYTMGYNAAHSDFRYDCNCAPCRAIMEKVQEAGMMCGFHGGLRSCSNALEFTAEKERVERALRHPVATGRQHYLCFDARTSPAIWDICGMESDSTLGFFDHEGFMCGTCRPYPLFDVASDRQLGVMERPLLMMDISMRDYRHLSIEESWSVAKEILARVKAVGGDFVMLWHNTSVCRDWKTQFEQFYMPFAGFAAKELQEVEIQDAESNAVSGNPETAAMVRQ